MKTIGWNFDNSYETLPKAFYEKVDLHKFPNPKLEILNQELAKDMGLDYDALKTDGLPVLLGQDLPEGASSIAQAYMGHQFGYLTMLGDGRALLIGEQITPEHQRYDLQYKGSGKTPFSRGGDGKASLGPMLREYIVSEGMYHLGIPSSRTLSVASTGETVARQAYEKGALMIRVASSHLRVGTFVYASQLENMDLLKALADYTINRHFPDIKNKEHPYAELYKKVIRGQASLIAEWMAVGFIHGVMNTDNVSIAGETFDYGPCAYLDIYEPTKSFSSIDHFGRYAYDQQAKIGYWNLEKLGLALLPLFAPEESETHKILYEALEEYKPLYKKAYYHKFGKKLGLFDLKESDYSLVDEFLEILRKNELDFTNSFLDLTFQDLFKPAYYTEEFKQWQEKRNRLLEKEGHSKEEVLDLMKKNNPAIIPRNHWVEKALAEAIGGDNRFLHEFVAALQNPYAHTEEQKKYRHVPENKNYVTYCGT